MRHSLVVIGNGFDLSIGLKSSFKDFLNNHYKLLVNNIKPFMKLYNIYSDPKNTSYYYNGNLVTPSLILQNIDGFDIKKKPTNTKKIHDNGGKIYRKDNINNISRDFKLKINNSLKKEFNFWAFYFEVKKYEQDPDWSNIESDIYHFIMRSNNDYTNNNYDNIYYIIDGLHDTYNQHINSEKFTTKLANDLNEKGKFLIYLLIYIIKCISDDMGLFNDFYISKHDKSSITNVVFLGLKNQLINLEKGLNDYLLNCVSQYKEKYDYSYNYMSNLLLYYMTYNQRFSLIDFNYTTPLKDMNVPVLNIHGKLQKDSNNSNEMNKNFPIIGVSNDNIAFSDHAYKFTKNYKIMKLSYNENILQDKSINEIEFFDHSFDGADFSYFRDIFNRYNITSPNNKITLVFYYVPHSKLDDSGDVRQIKKIDNLFRMYYLSKLRDTVNFNNKEALDKQVNIKAENLLHILKFKGQLVIKNLYDKLKINKKFMSKIRSINGYDEESELPF